MANSIPGIGGSSSSPPIDLADTSRASKKDVQGVLPGAGAPASSLRAGDAIDLSNLGTFIATAAKQAGAQSSTRPELIVSLRAQIAAGTYHPDPDEVAARVAAAIKP